MPAGKGPPKYQRIAGDLRSRIAAGEFPVDSRLPSKSELMAEYAPVALATVESAIGVLRREGLIETLQGSGMYVRALRPADGVAQRLAALEAEMARVRDRLDRGGL